MATTPELECSPATSLADSFPATPGGDMYSLFPSTLSDPIKPEDDEDEEDMDHDLLESESRDGTPSSDKKPTKKRKSWGQVLPEPKTNLPPRKRAKTEDEKEQRRVERVLRNRRAAQSSRERKRLEVEALENEKRRVERLNKDLEMRLQQMESQNLLLAQRIHSLTGEMPVFGQSSSTASSASPSAPITLSQELFSGRDGLPAMKNEMDSINLQASIRSQTVNPASLSPKMVPVGEELPSVLEETRHPAEMLCDLQCPPKTAAWTPSSTSNQAIANSLMMTLWITLASATTSAILNPLWQINSSLRTRSCLPSTPSVLNLIIWLVTTPASLTASTSTTTSTHTTTSRTPLLKFSLRISLLRSLLACSPNLARPLKDATVVALRLAAEQQLSTDCLMDVDGASGSGRLRENSCATKEALMTLLWAIDVIQREQQQPHNSKDVTEEIRQASGELEELLSQKRVLSRPSDKAAPRLPASTASSKNVH